MRHAFTLINTRTAAFHSVSRVSTSHRHNTPSNLQVRARVLELIASDPGVQQSELVLLGLFGRSVRLLNASGGKSSVSEVREAATEAAALVELLASRHAALCTALDAPGGGFPDVRACVWHAPTAAQAAVQGLLPQMTENRKKVGKRTCHHRALQGTRLASCQVKTTNIPVCVAWRVGCHVVCAGGGAVAGGADAVNVPWSSSQRQLFGRGARRAGEAAAQARQAGCQAAGSAAACCGMSAYRLHFPLSAVT